MKKILFIVTISAAIFSCSKVKKGEFLITGTAKGYADGKTVVLEKQDEMMGLIPVDTVKIKGGKFEITGKITEPAIYTIQIQDAQGKIPVIVENEAITVLVDKDSIQNSKVSGSYNNDEFMKFNEEMKVSQKKVQKEMEAFQNANMAAMEAAQKSQDTVVVNKLRKDFGKIQEKITSKYTTYAETHPKSFISVLIVEGMFKQPGLDIEKAKKMYNSLDQKLKDTKSGKAAKLAIDNFGKPQVPAAPMPAPAPAAQWINNFSAPNTEGKIISLKSVAGKVTIVDFWASWCGPCRAENPNIVAIYKEFHSKGLNIIGVSLDDNELKWKSAIQKDKLNWNQVSNLKGWQDPIAKQYGVESIPATFIFDANGKLMAKDLRGTELKSKIASMLLK